MLWRKDEISKELTVENYYLSERNVIKNDEVKNNENFIDSSYYIDGNVYDW